MQATSNTQAWSSTVLDDCHRLVLTHIHALMKKMFGNSDTAFQEFIDKAQSSASQLRFMEAMSIINTNRNRVEEIFYRQLGTGFKEFSNLKFAAKLGAAQRSEPLSLVSKEDSDIQVALQNMTSSASAGASHVLYAIRQRLSVLNNGSKLEEDQIPGGPHALANAFHQAAQELVLEHETRLIVYMLFDKFVLSKAALMYDEFNQRLLKAGLLPNLKYEVHKYPVHGDRRRDGKPDGGTRNASGGSAAASDVQGDSGGDISLGDELFNNIMQLLSRRDRPAGGNGPAEAVANPLPKSDVVSAIHQLQLKRHSDPSEQAPAPQVPAGAQQQRHLVKTMLAQLSNERDQLFTGIDRRRLPSADTQVIDLVGMMFEYMLNDADLPSVAKAELSRLHTPYLKVAIIDKSLFTNSRHPAHELLNMLAAAGTKWVFENDLTRGIFPTMRMVVQRIIEEFDSNIEIFGELLELCRNSIRDLENRATAIEQRTRQAAAGKEKLELARNCAAEAIESRVSGHNLPDELLRILRDTWIDKLMFIYLREPESEYSTTWSLAIQTIGNIIWSVEPRTTDAARDELRAKLPNLRRKIERAFEMLDVYGASDNAAQLAVICRLQDAVLAAQPEVTTDSDTVHGGSAAPACDSQKPVGGTVTAAPTPPVSTTEGPPATAPEQETVSGASDEKAEAQQPVSNPSCTPEQTGTVSPAESGEEKPASSKRLSPKVRKALALVDDLAFGTWFTFSLEADATPARLKLSWFSQVSGNYMFVDSMGVKAAVKNRIELATLLANGHARIVGDDRQTFVQRAMYAVRRMLSGDDKTGT